MATTISPKKTKTKPSTKKPVKNQQRSDYLAVKRLMERNPGLSAYAAIRHVAKSRNKTTGSVQANYYTIQRRERDPILPDPQEALTSLTASLNTLAALREENALLKKQIITLQKQIDKIKNCF